LTLYDVPMSSDDRERWNTRFTTAPWPHAPSPWLLEVAELLTHTGSAIDIAGGTGRNALWLAEQGWNVTVADVSDVAIGIAEFNAAEVGAAVDTVLTDLSTGPVPSGPWDAMLLFHYLHRPLIPRLIDELAPAGLLVGALATVKNLERNERPPLPYLLDEGELPDLLRGLGLLRYKEGWRDDHHEARFVARKP
jgi:tellurite methyltransferase